jgi:hypothetical protein
VVSVLPSPGFCRLSALILVDEKDRVVERLHLPEWKREGDEGVGGSMIMRDALDWGIEEWG